MGDFGKERGGRNARWSRRRAMLAPVAFGLFVPFVEAEVVFVEPDLLLGEYLAGYLGYASGGRFATPYNPFLPDAIVSQLSNFTDDITYPEIDVRYDTRRTVDLGPAGSTAEIDAIINPIPGTSNGLRGVDVYHEVSAFAPPSTNNDDHYAVGAGVQLAFLFEVTDEPVRINVDGSLFAEPYSGSELWLEQMDPATVAPDEWPDVVTEVFRVRTMSTQTASSSLEVDIEREIGPGLYFLSTFTSVVRGAQAPGESLSTQMVEVVFGGGPQRWIDGQGGLFSDGENWESGAAPESADPILFDIVNDGYVVVMDVDPSVASIDMPQGTVSFDFNGGSGAAIDVSGAVTVGETPGVRAGLDVIGGEMVAASMDVGTAAGSDALVTLREGAVLEVDALAIGSIDSGTAQFFAISGAMLDVGAGDSVQVVGPNTLFTAETLTIGETGVGGGELAVRSGAVAVLDSTLTVAAGDVSVSGTRNDTVSTLEAARETGALFVETEGTLTVSDGGIVESGNAFDNPTGDLVVNAVGPVREEALFSGAGGRATSTALSTVDLPQPAVRVDGEESQISVFGTAAIGLEQTGAVAVTEGGRLAASRVGLGSGADGSLDVTGIGSEVFTIAMDVGTVDAGRGLLNVGRGAAVEIAEALSVNHGEVHLRGSPGGVGDPVPDRHLMVGADLEGQIVVGPEGRLYVTDAARVQIGTSIFDLSADLFVDADTPLTDTAPVSVSGEGSLLDVYGQIAIGSIDDGRMAVAAGAEVTVRDISLGSELFDGISGRLEVSGVGTSVFAREMLLGGVSSGSGVLTVTDGAGVDVLHELVMIRSNVLVEGGMEGDDSRLFIGESNPDEGRLEVGRDSRFTVSGGAAVEVGQIADSVGAVIVDTVTPSSEPAPFTVTGEGSRLTAFGDVAIGLFDDGRVAVSDGGSVEARTVTVGVGSGRSGELTVSDFGSRVSAGVVNVSSAAGAQGTLQVEDGAGVEALDRLNVNDMGIVFVSDDSWVTVGPGEVIPVSGSVVVGPGGELWGTGSIVTNVEVDGGLNNFGTVYPGSSPGVLTIDGDYFQGEEGMLVIEIGGSEAGAQYDVLNVLGDATIEGAVVFEFIDGFLPSEGDSFDFLLTEGIGDIARAMFEIANLAPGFDFEVERDEGGLFRMLALNDGAPAPIPLPPGWLLLTPACAVLAVASRKKEGDSLVLSI